MIFFFPFFSRAISRVFIIIWDLLFLPWIDLCSKSYAKSYGTRTSIYTTKI